MTICSVKKRITWLTTVAVAALLTGCPDDQQSAQRIAPVAPPAEPRASVALRVLVVNEPELAEAINRLRGEWNERSGGELSASAVTWQDLIAGKNVADVIVFPSRYLGEMCVRDWLRSVRPSVLESQDFDAADVFPLARRDLIHWGGQVMALPLGVDLPRPGEETDRRPAISLLAQAAPNAVSKERLGVLFDLQTMKPRIAEPPFVDALSRLTPSHEKIDSVRPGIAASPSVLGYSDRLAAVTTMSRNAASAFQLLEWLAQPDTSSQLARVGDGTMPVRRSLASSTEWYEPSLSASQRAALGKTLESALSQQECLIIPRIPGIDEYMAALDEAVKNAVFDGVAPQAALEMAAMRWDEITDSHGRDAQRKAYLKHLGVNDP